MNALRRWADTEPVRLYVWPAVVLIAGALVAYGATGENLVNVVLGVVALALGLPAATVARRAVTSPATLRTLLATARDVADTAARPKGDGDS